MKYDKVRDYSKTCHCKRLHFTRKLPKQKVPKQSISICVEFFLGLYMTYLCYCLKGLSTTNDEKRKVPKYNFFFLQLLVYND